MSWIRALGLYPVARGEGEAACSGSVPFPEKLPRYLRDPSFWAAYLFEDDGDALDGEDLAVRFELGGKHALELKINLALGYHSLLLDAPGLDTPAEIVWDDEAHCHPHVFRWDELDLVCRAMAAEDAELAHPGAPLALLRRFLFLSGGEDLDVIVPCLDAAFQRFRPAEAASWPTTRDWLDWRDLCGMGVTWHEFEGGLWTVQQQGDPQLPLYSLRYAPDENDHAAETFPFAAWAASARAPCTAVRRQGRRGRSRRPLAARESDKSVAREDFRDQPAGSDD